MPRLEQKQSLKQTLSPRQILQAKLLNLNSLSLESYILNEIESNPVLESVESDNEGEDEVFEAEDDSLDVLPIDDEYAIIQPKGEQKDILDSYQDNLGSERIGNYINFLLKSFKQKLSRSEAIAITNNQFTKNWGKDKIIQ